MAKELGFRLSIEGTDKQIRELGELKDSLIRLGQERKKLEKQAKTAQGLTAKETKQLGDLIQKEKELRNETTKLNNTIKSQNKELSAAAGSYDKLTAQNARLTAQIRKLGDPLGKNNKEFQRLSKIVKTNTDTLKTLDAQMGRSFRNVGNYTGAIKEGVNGMGLFSREAQILTTIQKSLSQLTATSTAQQLRYNTAQATGSKVTRGLAKAQLILNKVLKASPIFLLVGVLSSVAAFFTKTQRGADTLERGMAALNTTVDVLVDRLSGVGEGLSLLFSGDITGGLEKLKGTFTGIGDEIKREVKLVDDLTKRLQELRVQEVNDSIKAAKIRQDINELRLKVEDKEKFSVEERIAFNREAFKLEEDIAKVNERNLVARANQILQFKDEAQARERINQAINEGKRFSVEELGLSESKIEDLEELGELTKQLVEIESERSRKQRQLLTKEQTLLSELNKKRMEALKLEEARLKAIRQIEKEEQQRYAELDTLIQEGLDNELKAWDEKEKAMRKYYQDLIDEAERTDAELSAIEQKEIDEDAAIIQSRIDNRQRLKQMTIDFAIQQAAEVSAALFQAADERFARQQEQELERYEIQKELNLQRVEDEATTENDVLRSKLEKGLITEQQFEQQKDDIDANKRKQQEKIQKAALDKEIQLEREAFERKKRIDTAQALINGALAITNILANTIDPTPVQAFKNAQIAFAGITTAIQVATIQSQKFAKGGLLVGDSHDNGGIPFSVNGRSGFEAEGGEAIINKRSTSMFKGLLSEINAAGGGVRFARGGLVSSPSPSANVPTQLDAVSLQQQVQALSQTIRVENVATETASVNSEVLTVENLASA